jgi:hypothetical protein
MSAGYISYIFLSGNFTLKTRYRMIGHVDLFARPNAGTEISGWR